MPINKIIYDDNVLIDLTEDSVTPETLLKGVTAHDKAGNLINGVHECAGGEGAVIKTQGGWEGTAVPNEGYVENVYFNTALSVEEVNSILSSIVYHIPAEGDWECILAFDTDNICIMNVTSFGYGYVIASTSNPDNVFYCSDEQTGQVFSVGFVGWNTNIIYPIAINKDVISVHPDGDYPVGTQNDKLSSLFSTTPFVQATGEEVILEGNYDGSTVEVDVQAAGSASGTAVPSDDVTTIEKVYVNTSMSPEDVVSLLSQITYVEEQAGMGAYIVAATPQDEKILTIAKMTGNLYAILGIDNITRTETPMFAYMDGSTEIGMVGFSGWNTEFNGVMEINGSSLSMVGLENDKLSSLFSITPFVESEPCIDLKSYIDNKQIPLKINLTNIPSAVIKTQGGWEGTAVPNEGYVENVYFNTNLSVEEVVSILSQLDYNSDGMTYMGITTSDQSKFIQFGHIGEFYGIVDVIAQGFIFANAVNADIGVDFVGWRSDYNGITIFDDNVISSGDMDGTIFDIGHQNSKLTSLFSITPFVQSTEEEILLEGEYDGSTKVNNDYAKKADVKPVPNSGYVNRVYFDTSLNIDEVVEIIDSIGSTSFLVFNDQGANNGVWLLNMQGMYLIMTRKDNEDTYIFSSVSNPDMGVEAGWLVDEANYQFDAEIHDSQITEENREYINKLVSLTSFEIDPVSNKTYEIDLKPYIEKKEIPLNIKVNVPSGGEVKINIPAEGVEVPGDRTEVDVYCNTNLSTAEVDAILDTLEINGSAASYTVYRFMAGSDAAYLQVHKGYPGWYIYDPFTRERIYDSTGGSSSSFEGWNPNFNGVISYVKFIEDNGYGYAEELSDNQNYKLVNLFSAEPYDSEAIILSGEYDGSVVEVDMQAAEEWQGTAIPCGGESIGIEKIYLNTNLSTDEVVEILQEFFEKHPELGPWYTCDGDGAIGVDIMNNDDGTTTYSILNDYDGYVYFSSGINYYANFVGWNSSFNGVIESTPDYQIISEDNEIYTSELSNLFSVMPFVKTEANTIDLKPYIDNKQIPLNIKVNVPSGGVIEVSELPTENIQEGVIYKTCDKFTDISIIYEDEDFSINTKLSKNAQIVGCEIVDSKPTSDIVVSDFTTLTCYLYYVKDEKDIFLYGNIGYGDMWISASLIFQQEGINVSFKGEIFDDDIVTENGYYAYLEPSGYYQYDGTSWQRYKFKGQEVVVEPSKWEEQVIEPTGGNGYLSKVTVNKVTSDIDVSITPDNIVYGRSILGVRGTALTFEDVHSASSSSFIDKIEGHYHMKPYIFHRVNAHVIDITLGISTGGGDSDRECDLDLQCFSHCKAHTIKLKGEGRLTTLLHHAGVNNHGNITLTPDCFRACENLNKLVLDFPDFGPLPVRDEFPDLAINFLYYTPIANGTGYIYVPDALVDTVKSLDGWSTYASRIRPLSEYAE